MWYICLKVIALGIYNLKNVIFMWFHAKPESRVSNSGYGRWEQTILRWARIHALAQLPRNWWSARRLLASTGEWSFASPRWERRCPWNSPLAHRWSSPSDHSLIWEFFLKLCMIDMVYNMIRFSLITCLSLKWLGSWICMMIIYLYMHGWLKLRMMIHD
jgi:hypothetical protein